MVRNTLTDPRKDAALQELEVLNPLCGCGCIADGCTCGCTTVQARPRSDQFRDGEGGGTPQAR